MCEADARARFLGRLETSQQRACVSDDHNCGRGRARSAGRLSLAPMQTDERGAGSLFSNTTTRVNGPGRRSSSQQRS